MPYAPDHKVKTRQRIVESARILFNRHGFEKVSIDQIMAEAGLTRGGFYNHFPSKEALYADAVASFLNGRGKTWREEAGVDPEHGGPETVIAMIESYLSAEHLNDLGGQCPMIALPSDTARATQDVQQAYERLLRAMYWLFAHNLPDGFDDKEDMAHVLCALCIGGMVLSRTVEDSELADRIRVAAKDFAISAVKTES